MGLICRIAALAILTALLPSTTLLRAEEAGGRENRDEKMQEAPEEWEQNLFSFEPIRIDSSVLEHQIEIIVHRWGTFTKTQKFSLTVENKPGFMQKAWWSEGETIEFAPEETEKTVNIRFTLAEAGNVKGDLVFSITAEEAEQENILPHVRRFELPFGFGREKGEGCVYALKEDAPEKIEPNELHEWIDLDIEPVYSCDDRIAVFFTPAVDLEAENVEFRWMILPPKPEKEGEDVIALDGGFYAPPDGIMHRELEINPFQDIPGKFIVELPPRGRSVQHWNSYGGWVPGLFRVQTAREQKSGSTLFGFEGSVATKYVEVATFQFTPLPDLQLVGLRTDSPQNVNLGALPWCYDGTLQMRAAGSGRTLRLDMEASYRRISRTDEAEPEEDSHQISYKARIELPETLKLGQHVMGEGKVICDEFSQGPSYYPLRSFIQGFAGIGNLVAVSDRQPGDWLFFGEDVPYDMGTTFFPDGPKTTMFGFQPFDRCKVLFREIPERGSWTYQVGADMMGEHGWPQRKLGFHLRDSGTVFILPVRFSFPTQAGQPPIYEVFSYAIYKAKEPQSR